MTHKLSKYAQDVRIREVFNRTKRAYRKATKRARVEYKQNIAYKLETDLGKNPKKYWKLLNDLKNIDKVTEEEQSPISEKKWTDHYTNLLEKKTNRVKWTTRLPRN